MGEKNCIEVKIIVNRNTKEECFGQTIEGESNHHCRKEVLI